MLKRTITGFFILLVLAGFIALREVSILFFDAFVLFLIYGCLFEVLKARGYHKHKFHSALLYIYPTILAAIYVLSSSLYMSLLLQILAALVYFVILMLAEVIRLAMERKTKVEETKTESLLSRVKECMEVILYPTTLLGFLFGINHLGKGIGYVALLLALSVTIFSDVFAYLFGRMIKGPKFVPEISPNKTISGTCFGVLGGVVVSAVCWALFVHLGWLGNNFAGMSTLKTLSLFLMVGVLGTLATILGDLVESAYKRKLAIKDFGSILPGHGGFMDRVDGLMMTATLTFAMFALFM